MKKFLSVVLALVMTMSLVTITAGAKDFTDKSKITYGEAVDVISQVGVIDGYTDGSFNPSATLTRGAAAKIICNLILGPTTGASLGADAAPFKDVPVSNVFAGYIAYCSQQGIINGYADGTFKPAGTVTGYQFMKMLLGALGYDGKVEGFTGSNWSVAVAKLAVSIGLDDGNDSFVGTAAMTREQACLYAFNTLKATMVKYDNSGTSITVGGTTITTGASKAESLENSAAKADQTITQDAYMQFAEKYFKDLKKGTTSYDDMGNPATTWKYKTTTIGTYVDNSDLQETYTAKVTRANLYDVVGSDVLTALTKGTSTLNVWVDGNDTTVAKGDVASYIAKNDGTAIYTSVTNSSRKGVLTKVYVDDSNNVTVTIVNTYVFQATSDYNSSKNEVKISAAGDTAIALDSYTLSGDDFDIANVKADDYLLVTAYRTGLTGSYTAKTVTPATVVTGTVSSYSTNNNVTVGGTKYEYSAICLESGDKGTSYSAGQDATVILDSYGYVIAVDEAQVSSSYVYIAQFGATSSLSAKAVADAYFTDGTNSEITVKKVGSVSSSSTIAGYKNDGTYINHWYTYTKNSAGEYTLTAAPSKYTAGNQAYSYVSGKDNSVTNNGVVKFLYNTDNGSNSVKANDKTLLIVKDTDGDVMAYTGTAKIPDITLKSGSVTVYYLTDSNGYVTYAFVNLDGTGASLVDGGETADYIYVMKYDSQTYVNDSTTYYTYKVIKDGAETTINCDSALEGTSGVYGLFYKSRSNADGYITSLVEVPTSGEYFNTDLTAATVSYSNGSLSIGSESYTLASDSTITLISRASALNKDSSASYEVTTGISAKTLASMLDGYKFSGNISGATTSSTSSTIKTLYVTVDGIATFSGVSVSKASLSVAAAGTGTFDVVLPAGYTAAVTSSATAKATVSPATAPANATTTITVSGVAAGSTTVNVAVTNTASSVTATYTVDVTVTA